jgi:hypothetical protein
MPAPLLPRDAFWASLVHYDADHVPDGFVPAWDGDRRSAPPESVASVPARLAFWRKHVNEWSTWSEVWYYLAECAERHAVAVPRSYPASESSEWAALDLTDADIVALVVAIRASDLLVDCTCDLDL